MFRSVQEDAQGRQESEHPDPQELGSRPWPADQPDRGGGDSWHEREELEADVNERTQKLRCLLIVESQPVVGVHGRPWASIPGGADGQAIEAAAALNLVLSSVRSAFRGRAVGGWRDSQGRSRA